jgi:hypothetical protein
MIKEAGCRRPDAAVTIILVERPFCINSITSSAFEVSRLGLSQLLSWFG